jgi:TolA-binding protein
MSESGECSEAVKIYDNILQIEAQRAFHSQSLLRKGACLVTLNKFDDAKASFEKARTEFPDSFSGEMAQGYERLIEVKKGSANAQ